jgi:hypothetical protein
MYYVGLPKSGNPPTLLDFEQSIYVAVLFKNFAKQTTKK